MIEQYFTELNGYLVKDSKAVRVYDNVASMKSDTNLKVNMYVKTKGYYTANDGGNSEYLIRSKTQSDIEDNGKIHFIGSSLVAELITDKTINIKQFGAVGDGIEDDTTVIQNALDSGYNIIFEKGKTYKVTEVLRIKDDTHIDLNSSTLVSTTNHLIYNFLSTDTFLGYNGNGNITIKNGFIEGGCISLFHGKGIIIDNIEFKNTLNNHYIELCSCKDVYITNSKFYELPESTYRLEPINIDPCIYDSFPWVDSDSVMYDNTVNYNINVSHCYFDGGNDKLMDDGVGCHTNSEYHQLYINIHDNVIKNTRETGVILFGCDYSKVYNNTMIGDKYGVQISGSHDCVYNNKITSLRESDTFVVNVLANSDLLSVYNNMIYENGKIADRYIYLGNQVTHCSFMKIDKIRGLIGNTSFSSETITVPIDSRYKLTEFNNIKLCIGGVSDVNGFRTFDINSYFSRMFNVNDIYRIPELSCTLKITGDNEIQIYSSTDLNVRQIILSIE